MTQGKRDACKICEHPQVRAIDRGIMAGDSLRDIATCFATSKDAVSRHKNVCMKRLVSPPAAAPVPPAYNTGEEVKRGEDIAKWSRGLLGKVIGFMNTAEQAGDLRTAVSAVREARATVELIGRIQGDLGPSSQVNVQVLNAPSMTQAKEWPIFITIIEKYPHIKAELTEALLLLEGK
jgi:hypothetical protein